jgi:hypothetical protein
MLVYMNKGSIATLPLPICYFQQGHMDFLIMYFIYITSGPNVNIKIKTKQLTMYQELLNSAGLRNKQDSSSKAATFPAYIESLL